MTVRAYVILSLIVSQITTWLFLFLCWRDLWYVFVLVLCHEYIKAWNYLRNMQSPYPCVRALWIHFLFLKEPWLYIRDGLVSRPFLVIESKCSLHYSIVCCNICGWTSSKELHTETEITEIGELFLFNKFMRFLSPGISFDIKNDFTGDS